MLRLTLLAAIFSADVLSAALPSGLLKKDAPWFRSAEGLAATANILSWQAASGAWPKNQDNSKVAHEGDAAKIQGTFDNKATTDELRYLARAFEATHDDACAKAFLRGLDHILAAQYPNGGFPQFHPPGKGYPRHITFNDDTMVHLLNLLRFASDEAPRGLVDHPRREAARKAFERGVDCIVKCQVVIEGRRTVWCAQHDEKTLAPAGARAFELASLSGCESAGILRLLMSIKNPSPQVTEAVKAGAAWFEQAKVEGLRVEKTDGAIKITEDADAPVLWARFYDLETGRPFFCGRDGVKKDKLSEIDAERRNGYAWYGAWGNAVLKEYAAWPQR